MVKVGSKVSFHSPEYGFVKGVVIDVKEGLYGIKVEDMPGTFWCICQLKNGPLIISKTVH